MKTSPEVGTPEFELMADEFMKKAFRANPNGAKRSPMIYTENRGWHTPSPEEFQEWLRKHTER